MQNKTTVKSEVRSFVYALRTLFVFSFVCPDCAGVISIFLYIYIYVEYLPQLSIGYIEFLPNCQMDLCIEAVGKVLDRRPPGTLPSKESILEALQITMSCNNGTFWGVILHK